MIKFAKTMDRKWASRVLVEACKHAKGFSIKIQH
jgi:hypothetical protein